MENVNLRLDRILVARTNIIFGLICVAKEILSNFAMSGMEKDIVQKISFDKKSL